MGDELLTKAEQTPVTRKKLLKRAGVGALALGALPMIGASPAWAQPRNRCLEGSRAGSGTGCVNACSAGSNDCFSTCSADGACYCAIQTNGCCVCIDFSDPSYSCSSTTCSKNGDCPRGYACIDAACCGGTGPGICVKKCTRPAGVAAAGSIPPLGR
jgi:hypothetical protein